MIVVAEDHADIRYIIQRTLQRAGHEVVAAADGVEALEAIQRHRPELVVSDIDMPRMNGLDLCRAIRADPELRNTPVVLVSGGMLPGDPRATEAGASSTLLKPFLPRELLAAIVELIPDSVSGSRTTGV